MRDPLDQWAEGGSPGAPQGDSPDHTAQLAGEWKHFGPGGATGPSGASPGGANAHGWAGTGQGGPVPDPANMRGPGPGPGPYGETGQPYQPPPQTSWETRETIRGEVARSRTQAAGGPAAPPAQTPPGPGARPAPGPGQTPGPAPGPGHRQQQPVAPVPARPMGHAAPAVPGGVAGNPPARENNPNSRFGPTPPRAPHPKRRRPLLRTAVVLLALLLTGFGSTFAWAEVKLQRDVDLNKFTGRPPAGKGINYLFVGSDSRAGLSAQDRDELNTGVAGGRRTDSMILMHKGANGTTMMSLPRDSWVTVPGYRRPSTGKNPGEVQNKLNATYALGGPELLIATIEHNTGLRIDHYAEIGFGGFVNIVNAVGGVPMCIQRDIKDKDSGADFKKGCQTLNGAQALAFVRQRKQEAQGDLGRTKNQQQFLSALARKATSPSTMRNPSGLFSAVSAGLDALVVDQDMSMRAMATMFRSLQGVSKGGGKQINVPTAGGISTSKGDALRWNEAQAKKLFSQLRQDRPVTVTGK